MSDKITLNGLADRLVAEYDDAGLPTRAEDVTEQSVADTLAHERAEYVSAGLDEDDPDLPALEQSALHGSQDAGAILTGLRLGLELGRIEARKRDDALLEAVRRAGPQR